MLTVSDKKEGAHILAEETEKSAEATELKAESEKTEIKEQEPAKSENALAATPAATSPEPVPAASGSHSKDKERNLLAVASETLGHINNCEKNKSIVFRHNDRKSVIFMLSAFALEFAILILFVLDPATRPLCVGLAILSDVLFGLAILWYVLLRFGVLRSFDGRQTVLTWQLMIGAGAMFAYYTMNIAFIFFTYYNAMANSTPHPL